MKMKRNIYYAFCTFVLFATLMFSSCASKKGASSGTGVKGGVTTEMLRHNREVFDKVSGNAVTSSALSSKMKFTVETAGKDMSVAGQIEMKQDSYIRIRLTPMGLFEVAMIEFTTDYVLVLDRMHKEYIKASYAELPFLQANGIDFYALQSMFRNTIFVPGSRRAGAGSYKDFDWSTQDGMAVASAEKGRINYRWYIEDATGKIDNTLFTYRSGSGKSELSCRYSEFDDVAGRPFPHRMSMNFSSDMTGSLKNLSLTVASKKIKTEQKGSGRLTSIPRRYKEKDIRGLLNKILEIK